MADQTKPHGLLLVISGPSGVGKTTITHHVERAMQGVSSVSVTTRPKAHADLEGHDYFFIDREEFERSRDAGDLLEWAEVFGHYYGTPRDFVQRKLDDGRLVILEIDVKGAIQVKKNMPDAVAVFVLPPGEEELLRRLHDRAREPEDVIQLRFAKATDEIAQARACGAYDHFVINDDLNKALEEAVGIVRARMG